MTTVAPTGPAALSGNRGWPLLDLALAILIRSSGEVQLGWDPDRAVLIRPPLGVSARSLGGLLNQMDGTSSHPELAASAIAAGIDEFALDGLLTELGRRRNAPLGAAAREQGAVLGARARPRSAHRRNL